MANEMREKAIRNIESAIWATEHMNTNKGNKILLTNQHGMAQGVILMAWQLEIITEEEYNKYWEENNQAKYRHPACFE